MNEKEIQPHKDNHETLTNNVSNLDSKKSEAGLFPISGPPLAETYTESTSQDTQSLTPPNGGLYAWLRVFGAFLVFLNVWGFTISFGAFQDFYETEYLKNYSSSAISWVGSLQGGLLLAVGVVAGPLFDLGYYRTCVFVGSFLNVFGLMMLSLSTQYYSIFLSQGACFGLGNGLLYIPSLTLMNMSFTTRRAIAMGIATSGIPIGGIIYTVVFQQLVPKIGFPWTVRVLGFFALAFFIVAIPCLFCGPAKPPGKARALFERKAFKDVPYLVFTSTNSFVFFGYIVPYFFIPTFAQLKLRSSNKMSLYLLIITQAGSLLGRPIIGLMAIYTGVMLPWLICCTVSGILALVWIAIDSVASFAVWCVIFGFISGPLVSLPPSVFPIICPDLKTMGTRMGMSWCFWSIANICGAPIGGALISLATRNFVGMQVWSGACMLVGTAHLIPLWVMIRKKTGRWLV